MKNHILHDFRISIPFKEKSSDRLKDLQKLKFPTNFDVNMTSLPEGVMTYTLNT